MSNKFKLEENKHSNIKKVIAIISGKGGVGKSTVTSLLALQGQRLGYKTAILDADIIGPSIPKIFGIKEMATANNVGIKPSVTSKGIKIMSTQLMLENETDPIIWRSPLVLSTVKQFYTDVLWEDIDYLFVDMPPGTGDIQLTLFQSIPVDKIVIVTSPQELVSIIVQKSINMAKMMKKDIIGVVENMSYFIAPDTKKRYNVFGESHTKEILSNHNLQLLGEVPIDSELLKAADDGNIEEYDCDYLKDFFERV